jgi:acyl-CoA thioester hydrolase
VDQYTKTFTVRWADCDANGHLRSTGYSDYAIEGVLGIQPAVRV